MAVVLEGYLRQETKQFGTLSIENIDATVTKYIADDASIDVSLFIFSTATLSYDRIGTYNASTSSWNVQSRIGEDRLPFTYYLYLVKSSDFPNSNYNRKQFNTSLAIGEYYCAVDKRNVNYYWTPATTPLSTPTGLYADNITSDSARIGWNAVENAVDYKVEYRQTGGGGLLSKNSAISLEGRAC